MVLIGVPPALLTSLAAFVPILGATVAGAVATLVALAANGPVDALLVLVAVTAGAVAYRVTRTVLDHRDRPEEAAPPAPG